MSVPNNRRREPGGLTGQAIAIWVGIVVVVLAVGPVYVAVKAGTALAGRRQHVPGNPFAVFLDLLEHTLSWPGRTGTVLLTGCYAVLVALATVVAVLVHRWRRSRSRVDRAAAYLGRGRDVAGQTRKTVAATASRLGVATEAPGLPIGVTVAGGTPLFSSWEDERVTIAGPRTGKTTSMVIPEILAAPGAVVVTSNKRDVVDATRDVREGREGGHTWVFDPQALVGEPPSWWWNPLSYVTDETAAAKLAQHFASGSRDRAARVDAFFDPAGQSLLANLLLAAALDRRPITDVYTWLTDPGERTAIDILDRGGFPLNAQETAGVIDAPERQRGGVYGTARQMASCLTNRAVATWVTPPSRPGVPEFSPDAFVNSADTLYSLSREGKGTAGPLVTALTVATVEAAEQHAALSAGGRLPVPLVVVLDEAANVCRWAELPDQYSHYGSRGIVIDTVLQSWSQGVQVWGAEDMRKLWSAANVAVYGGGVRERDFLAELAGTIGDYDRLAASTSYGRGYRSVSQQLHRERILDVDELAALPRGRAVVLASGSRPTLIRTVPWMAGPHADAVTASIRHHTPRPTRPAGAVTLPPGYESIPAPDPSRPR